MLFQVPELRLDILRGVLQRPERYPSLLRDLRCLYPLPIHDQEKTLVTLMILNSNIHAAELGQRRVVRQQKPDAARDVLDLVVFAVARHAQIHGTLTSRAHTPTRPQTARYHGPLELARSSGPVWPIPKVESGRTA